MPRARKQQTFGYLRVSKADQDLEKNKADILAMANELDLGKVEFVEEKVSGRISWKKRKLAGVMGRLGKGDNIVVSEMSRLGRSMLECRSQPSQLVKKTWSQKNGIA